MEIFETSTTNQAGYTSLANKYRPQTFEEVVGQESVSKTLTNALKTGRIAHAYLFYGPRGCGKTTTARLLAKALNCTGHPEDGPTAKPCGKCPQCIEIAASGDMDVLELDAASNTQVEKVREAIIDTVALASGRDRYKIFILDEVHMLSISSFNALLKTIEEPPSHVIFILATTELHKVPLTISSRCQTFRFKPITEEGITAHLMDLAGAENIELNEEAAKIIAKNSGGALRDALTILDRAISFSGGKVDKDLVSDMLGLLPQEVVKEAVLAVIKNDGAALHKVFETVQNEGFDAFSLLKDIKNAFGEIFYLSLGTGREPFPGAKDILNQASAGFIAGLTRKISKLIDEVKFSDTPLLSAEVGLFTIMENTLDIASFISRLETLESGGTGGIHTPAPAEKKSLIRESASVKNTFTEEKPATAPKKTQAASLVVKEGAYKSGLTDTGEMWAAFKKGLAENYPFLYDIAQDVQVDFEAEDSWILKFRAKDDYFKDTFQKRAKDLQETAQRTLGRNIKFGFTLSAGGAPVAKPAYSANTSAYGANASAFKPAVSAPKPAVKVAPAVKEPEIISKEEPFLDGDYSAFAGGESSPEEAGETAKKILNIFDGYIVEAI